MYLSLLTASAVALGALWLAVWINAPYEEDQPGFSCYSHGNRICADAALERDAWLVWDEKAEVSEPLRVEYAGTALLSPKLGTGQRALLGGDGRWYVFRTSHMTQD